MHMRKNVLTLVAIAGTLLGCSPLASTDGPTAVPTITGEASAVPTPTPTVEPLSITVSASGDILSHYPVTLSAAANAAPGSGSYDYAPMFELIKPTLEAADLAICHMETPISRDNSNLGIPGTLVFNSPRELAAGVKAAGYHGCDFASNHTWDYGLDGVAATEEVLRQAGLGFAGPSANQERAGQSEFYTVGKAKVAHLAFTYTYPNNWGPDTTVPEEAPWLREWLWPAIGSQGILEQAQRARAQGADFVIVSIHWGVEYQTQPTDEQVRIAHELLHSDAVDLILGDHVHVIQPCEKINGKHVIYGLGNSLSNQSPATDDSLLPQTQDGLVATFQLTRDSAGKITTNMSYLPTFVDLAGHVITPVTEISNPASFARTSTAINLLGGCDASVDAPR